MKGLEKDVLLQYLWKLKSSRAYHLERINKHPLWEFWKDKIFDVKHEMQAYQQIKELIEKHIK